MTRRVQRHQNRSTQGRKILSVLVIKEVCKEDVRIVNDRLPRLSAKNVTFTTWKHSRSLYVSSEI